MAGYGNADDGTEASLIHIQDSLELQRIASAQTNTTGHCMECGDPIPQQRLQVIPNAHLCIECAKAAEKDKSRARFIVKNHYQP